MELHPIRSEKEYQQYLEWVDELFKNKVVPGSPDGEKLRFMLLLIKQFEDQHHPIPKTGIPDSPVI